MPQAVFQVIAVLKQVQLGLGLVGTIGNALVCLTILKTKALHNVINYMFLNLAVADAIVSILNIFEPTIVENHRIGIGVFGYCTPLFIYNFSIYFMFTYWRRVAFSHSVLGLSLATFERYIGIVKPLHYSTIITKKRLMIMLFVIWLLPFLSEAYTPIFYIPSYIADNCTVPAWENYPSVTLSTAVSLIFVFIIPTIALAFMYAKILINLKRGARHLENQGIQGPPQELYRAHKKVTNSLIIVITAYFIFIIPDQILRCINLYGNYFEGDYSRAELVHTYISVTLVMNSAINPIMYGLSYGQLRRACIAMLCPFHRCKRSNHVTEVFHLI